VNTLFHNIQLLCIRSLLAVQKVIISDRHSFEMYGYDVLVDADLKPWLIEVNASPSLTANTPADYAMKLALLHDTMAVVDMERRSAHHARCFTNDPHIYAATRDRLEEDL
jgi:tubulin polyglutamylase TTLL9